MSTSLWGLLTSSLGKKDAIDAAKASIASIQKTLHSVPYLQVYATTISPRRMARCQQEECFDKNFPAIYKHYNVIASINPLEAIRILLELEDILGPHGKQKFWATSPKHIVASIADATPETRKQVFKHIFDAAKIGTVPDFILAESEIFADVFQENFKDRKFVEKFVRHSTPRTREFLEKFQTQFQSALTHHGPSLLSFIISYCPVSNPDDNTTKLELPDYIKAAQIAEQERLATIAKEAETKRLEELAKIEEEKRIRVQNIRNLAIKIRDLFFCESPRYIEITGCLQDLSDLGITDHDFIERLKSNPVREKSDVSRLVSSKRVEADLISLYLYKVPIVKATEREAHKMLPDYLYIVATRKSGYGSLDNSGVLRLVLISHDLQLASKSFQTLIYSNIAKKTLAGLVAEFDLRAKSPLTADLGGLKSEDEVPPALCPLSGNILPIEPPQPRPLH
jgi:hypothetical protein